MRVLGLTRTGAAAASLDRFDTGRRSTAADATEIFAMDRIDEMLAQSEILVVVVPLTELTRGMIGARELDLLPPRLLSSTSPAVASSMSRPWPSDCATGGSAAWHSTCSTTSRSRPIRPGGGTRRAGHAARRRARADTMPRPSTSSSRTPRGGLAE